jgi:hypothetical protein
MRYVIVSIVSGLLFGLLDGVINANPLARRLFEVYNPIAKAEVNAPVGIAIDLVYGFAMAGIFVLLYKSLPGRSGLAKGASFALMAGFFRVVMYSASQWMMFNVPAASLIYSTAAGLGEMLSLGLLYGLTLKPISSRVKARRDVCPRSDEES